MLIKIHTDIIVDVKDKEQAEEACFALNEGLDYQLRNFPQGEVVATDVDSYENVSEQEANEKGWVE